MDSRTLAGISAALGIAAGLGLGYALFHSDNPKQAPTTAPAAATSSAPTSASTSSGFTLAGKLTLKWSTGAFIRDESNRCTGSGGYEDIARDAAVTITDQTGTVIATGILDGGNADMDTSTNRPTACTFSFEVLHVPDGKTFYGVTVSHRGAIQFSSDQAHKGDVSLSLG